MKLFAYDSNMSNSYSQLTVQKFVDMYPEIVCTNLKYLNAIEGDTTAYFYDDEFFTFTIRPYLLMTWAQSPYTSAEYNPISEAFADLRELEVKNAYQSLVLDGGLIITVGNSIFKTEETILTDKNLDTYASYTIWNQAHCVAGTYETYNGIMHYKAPFFSPFEVGTDYYVYICDPSNGNPALDTKEVYKISKNSTYPNGYNASNSRKIGGFHYGFIKIVNQDSHVPTVLPTTALLKTPWMENNIIIGIVPNSVWTVYHRPKCSPEGMVYLNSGLWGDIYLSSDDGNYGLQSKYDKPILLDTRGINGSRWNWFSFVEAANRVGKRLPSYNEFCIAAMGSPAGAANNYYAFTSTDNTYDPVSTANYLISNCEPTFPIPGIVQNNICDYHTGWTPTCISSYNVLDLVGAAWKMTKDIFNAAGGNTDGDVVVQNKYIHYSIHASTTNTFYTRPGISTAATTCPIGYEIRVLRAGGNYRCSTHAGCRAINTDLSIFHSYPVTTMDAYGTTLDTIPDVAKDGEVSCAWLVCEAL